MDKNSPPRPPPPSPLSPPMLDPELDVALTTDDLKKMQFKPKTSFGLAPGEELRVCPYNPLHVVPSTSFWKHKLKCERKYKEQIGIPDAFTAMQYRNRYGSSIANGTPPPPPPLHYPDLSKVDELTANVFADNFGSLDLNSETAVSSIMERSQTVAEDAQAARTASTSVPGTSVPLAGEPGMPPIPLMSLADAKLPYFEPSGLEPAKRKEFRRRRHAAVGPVEEVKDEGKKEEVWEEYDHEHPSPKKETDTQAQAGTGDHEVYEDDDEEDEDEDDDDEDEEDEEVDNEDDDDEEENDDEGDSDESGTDEGEIQNFE